MADINIQDNKGATALMWATGNSNNIETVKLLLADERVNPNIQMTDGKTALMLAVDKNYFDIVTELLVHPKIDLGLRDKNGKTALDLAASGEIKNLLETRMAL